MDTFQAKKAKILRCHRAEDSTLGGSLAPINYIIKSKKTRKEQEEEEEQEKKTRFLKKNQKWSLGLREVVLRPYDEIKKCSDCHPESSHMGKNSSRRTPRPKNLIFVVF